ncbi:MAG TPA: T9SS type A sorting domain-containing protein [Ignavibacteria bacterium]|nr:T9SS type A sorting domain-containing protein [Ignavibacteria bacterium]
MKIKSSTNGPRTFTLNQYTGYYKGGQIEVDPDSYLWLETGSVDNNVQLITNAYCKSEIKQNGWLVMGSNSIVDIRNHGYLILYEGSKFAGHPSSKVIVRPGGSFCNYGAINYGTLTVIFESGLYVNDCVWSPDVYISDSTRYILSSGASFEIPENTTLHFQGSETLLQMDSNSAIKFGQNSKIVFENGARISAKHSKFIPLTSNATWSGIYLSDLSKDTLQNCIIENAVNGITIEDKLRVSEISDDVSTVITGCSIINSTTSTQLVNGIYAFNSSDILLKDNTVSSSQTNGFSIGMWLEYCSPVNVNIIGNTIGNSVNGINLLHSSPFISRNAITGQTGSTYGMYLDNSNSAIKNNTVSYFNYSLVASYSSPNLYGNTFTNASQVFLDLKKNSVPIMSPINAGTTLYWYGGRNNLSGNPSAAAIYISEESYPSINEGYNTVYSGINDYIEGDIPSTLEYGILYATNNYWNNSSFDPLYFNVSNGSVEYDPLFDGSSYPSFDTYSLIDIGFGKYDTVFAKILGDNSMSSMFMDAVTYEYAKNYSAAIGKYKDVISTYKESEYAALSVSRIFDCLQKMGGDISRYTANNTYLNGLKNNNQYPIIIRELAEDFIIKGKAKLGSLTEAISDYEAINQQNLNTQKGLHALINKECLTAFIADTLGDSQGSTFRDRTEHKNTLLNVMKLRTGNQYVHTQNSLVPDKYSLEQNYPNPFNPVTKIMYNIPKESRVTLVVYDILGREVAKLVNNEMKKAGTYIVEFNAFNFASGIYFYRLQAGDFVQTKRMVLVK